MPNRRDRRSGDWAVAAALLGGLALFSPLIELVDGGEDRMWFGLPAIYLYVFFVWGGMIALFAVASRRRPPPDDR